MKRYIAGELTTAEASATKPWHTNLQERMCDITLQLPGGAGGMNVLISSDVSLNIVEIRKPEVDSKLVAQGIADQLERRVAFISWLGYGEMRGEQPYSAE